MTLGELREEVWNALARYDLARGPRTPRDLPEGPGMWRYAPLLPFASIDGWLTVDEAIALYESEGYARIAAYGYYRDAPDTRCYAKDLTR